MNYVIDCEFDGYQGELISMALVRNDGPSLYMVLNEGLITFSEEDSLNNGKTKRNILGHTVRDPWVVENVLPILFNCPVPVAFVTHAEMALAIEAFLAFDPSPHIVSDWPDDLKYFNEAIIKGPGSAIVCPHMTQEWLREDAYPSKMTVAVQHNAWWDAMALRFLITGKSWNQ